MGLPAIRPPAPGHPPAASGPAAAAPPPPAEIEAAPSPFIDEPTAPGAITAVAPPPMPVPYLDENVQFTVYRPHAVAPGTWHRLLAFAHLSERPPDAPADALDPVDQVRAEAATLLGERARDYQDLTQDSRHAVPRMGELTLVPEITGFTFNPPRASLLWIEPVHRVEFRMRAEEALDGRIARGRLTVFLGGLILAEVPLTIRVNRGADTRDARPEVANARAYRRIFASYSHRDLAVVEQLEGYARALGDEYLRDWIHLRTGQVWSAELRRLIEQADVFQLFWSKNSMGSPFVRQEWEHALSLGRPGFVRPTYWEDPLPVDPEAGLPPPALLELHFQRLGVVVEPATPAASTSSPVAPADDDDDDDALTAIRELKSTYAPGAPAPEAADDDVPALAGAIAEPEVGAPPAGRSLLPLLLALLVVVALAAAAAWWFWLR